LGSNVNGGEGKISEKNIRKKKKGEGGLRAIDNYEMILFDFGITRYIFLNFIL